jgi:ribonuclease Z
MSEFIVTILGTSASMPTAQRALPAVLIQHEGRRFLVDCGEGTQRQMMKYGGLHQPDAVFLTHYHPDHMLGLPGMFASLNMMRDDAVLDPTTVYGPEGLGGIRSMCQRAGGHPSFVRFIDNFDSWISYGSLTITPFATDHGCASQGYVLQEDPRPGRIDVAKAKSLGVEGIGIGMLQGGDEIDGITLADISGPPRPGRKVVITGDTRPSPTTVEAAKNADLLIHEATFSEANRSRAKRVKHSTGREAGWVAKAANVDKLVLTHFSPREDWRYVAEQAGEGSQHSIDTLAAVDGISFDIPVK